MMLAAERAMRLAAYASIPLYDKLVSLHRSDAKVFREYHEAGIPKHAPMMWRMLTRGPKFRHGGRREKRLRAFGCSEE